MSRLGNKTSNGLTSLWAAIPHARPSEIKFEQDRPTLLARGPLARIRRLAFGVLIALPALSLAVTPAAARSVKYSSDLTSTSYVAQVPQQTTPFATQERSDEELLILQVTLENYLLSDGMFGFPKQGSLILPLSEFISVLDFPIEVDVENGRAEGWFISENNLFSLDLTASQVVIAGKVLALDPAFVEQLEDDIYVDVRTLAKWFPLDINFNLSELTVELEAREPLPLQQRIERQEAREKFFNVNRRTEKEYPEVAVPYQWISWPVSDTTVEFSVNSSGDEQTLTRSTTTLATADLAKLNADLFVSGNEDDFLTIARLKLGRQRARGGLLGKLDATEFAIGDVFSPQVKHVSRTEIGRGFSVTNAPLDQENEFDRITLQGDLQLGWELELYRNEILLDFRESQADGRYLFEDVPLLFGVNVLKLVFYGPQGQQREEIRQIRVGTDQITPGDHQYAFGINEQDRLFLMGNDKTQSDSSFRGKTRAAFQYKYGLSREISVGTNIVTIPFEGGHKVYTGVNTATNIGPFYVRADITKDVSGGFVGTLAAQSRIFGITVLGEHTFLNDFLSEEFNEAGDPLESQSRLRLDGVLRTGFLPHIPYSFNVDHESSKSRDRTTTVQNRVSSAFGRASVSNTLTLSISDPAESVDSENMSGVIQLGGNIGDVRTRGQLSYNVIPEMSFESAALSGDWKLDETFNASAGITKQLTGAQEASYSLGINTDLNFVAAGLSTSYSDNGDYSGTVSLTYSWGKDSVDGGLRIGSKPTAERGTMTARVFLDLDGDGTYTEGIDEALEGVGFKSDNSPLKQKTNEEGLAFVTDMDANKPVSFVVDEASLEDPFWTASPEGIEITLRPGVPGSVEFAVVSTGEIDGVVYLREEGLSEAAADVVIQLVDQTGQVAKQVRSQYDGFYLMDFVRPGSYTLRLDPEQLKRLGLPGVAGRQVDVLPDGTILNGEDFTIGGEAGATGQIRVYLTSFRSRAQAEAAWSEVSKALPVTLEGVVPEFEEKGTDPGNPTVVDLYGSPFVSRKAAEDACIEIKARYGDSWCNPLEITIK